MALACLDCVGLCSHSSIPIEITPLLPETPVGTPPAYIRAEAGEFVLADVRQSRGDLPKLLLQIGRHRLNFTGRCCDCNRESLELQTFESIIPGHESKLVLARCVQCSRAVKKYYGIIWLIVLLASTFLTTAGAVLLPFPRSDRILIACLLMPVNLAFALFLASSKSKTIFLHSIDAERGLVDLSFQCKAFERHVAACLAADEKP